MLSLLKGGGGGGGGGGDDDDDYNSRPMGDEHCGY